LLGRDWSLGLRYRVSKADLDQRLTEVPADAVWQAHVVDEGVLQQLDLSALYTHPCGFFAQAQGLWFHQRSEQQHLDRPSVELPDEDFWQLNLFVGYRFAQRRAELLVGGLNLTDQDYHLNPINLHAELPRARSLLVQFKFNF